jgi:hypothetical protein
MKKIALLVAFALVLPAWAQPAKEPAKEPEKPAPAAQETAKPKVAKKANPRRQEDARHCLEKSNNTEVIKCAEAYL